MLLLSAEPGAVLLLLFEEAELPLLPVFPGAVLLLLLEEAELPLLPVVPGAVPFLPFETVLLLVAPVETLRLSPFCTAAGLPEDLLPVAAELLLSLPDTASGLAPLLRVP